MGYYIQGPQKGKGAYLERVYGAGWCSEETARSALTHPTIVPVCVVDNGPFEAAALAYSEEEFECFANPEDRRRKRWFLMDRAKAYELAGFKG